MQLKQSWGAHTVPFGRKVGHPNNFHKYDALHARARARELVCPGCQRLALQTRQPYPPAAFLHHLWLCRVISLIRRLFITVDIIEFRGRALVILVS